jgi:hypothetical protein
MKINFNENTPNKLEIGHGINDFEKEKLRWKKKLKISISQIKIKTDALMKKGYTNGRWFRCDNSISYKQRYWAKDGKNIYLEVIYIDKASLIIVAKKRKK